MPQRTARPTTKWTTYSKKEAKQARPQARGFRLALKYGGECSKCGGYIPQGEVATYNPSRRSVRHLRGGC